jgi:hypothetical protein
MLLPQAGDYEHEHVCESLNLLGAEVLREFLERAPERRRQKEEELAPFIEKAMQHIEPIEQAPAEPVEAYPALWERLGADGNEWGARRALDAGSLWRLHVGKNVR